MKFENLFPIYNYVSIDTKCKIQHYFDLNNNYNFYLLKSNRFYFRILNQDIIKLNNTLETYTAYIFYISALKNYYWHLVNDAGLYKLYITYISMNYLIDNDLRNNLIYAGMNIPNIEIIKSMQIENKLLYLSAYKKFFNKLLAFNLLNDIKD